jgi:hypothetical protein
VFIFNAVVHIVKKLYLLLACFDWGFSLAIPVQAQTDPVLQLSAIETDESEPANQRADQLAEITRRAEQSPEDFERDVAASSEQLRQSLATALQGIDRSDREAVKIALRGFLAENREKLMEEEWVRERNRATALLARRALYSPGARQQQEKVDGLRVSLSRAYSALRSANRNRTGTQVEGESVADFQAEVKALIAAVRRESVVLNRLLRQEENAQSRESGAGTEAEL